MSAKLLATQFQFSHRTLLQNLDGLDHEASLKAPAEGVNNLNWVLGHIVATRNLALDLVGASPIWPVERAARYRGESPLEKAEAVRLEEIIADLNRSQEPLLAGLEGLLPERLSAPAYGQTVGSLLAALAFHESYHGGQVGILRRSLGYPGVIKPPKLPKGAPATTSR